MSKEKSKEYQDKLWRFALLMFAMPLIASCAGSLTGAIVGIILGGALIDTLSQVGIYLETWELGALLGFIFGFVAGSRIV